MAAVHVPEPPRPFIVLGKEQRRIHRFGRAFQQQPIGQRQLALEASQTRQPQGPQAGLESGPQECRCHSVSRHIADGKPEPMWAIVEEIVEITASKIGFDTDAGIRDARQSWELLRKQAGADLPDIFQVLDRLPVSAQQRAGGLWGSVLYCLHKVSSCSIDLHQYDAEAPEFRQPSESFRNKNGAPEEAPNQTRDVTLPANGR